MNDKKATDYEGGVPVAGMEADARVAVIERDALHPMRFTAEQYATAYALVGDMRSQFASNELAQQILDLCEDYLDSATREQTAGDSTSDAGEGLDPTDKPNSKSTPNNSKDLEPGAGPYKAVRLKDNKGWAVDGPTLDTPDGTSGYFRREQAEKSADRLNEAFFLGQASTPEKPGLAADYDPTDYDLEPKCACGARMDIHKRGHEDWICDTPRSPACEGDHFAANHTPAVPLSGSVEGSELCERCEAQVGIAMPCKVPGCARNLENAPRFYVDGRHVCDRQQIPIRPRMLAANEWEARAFADTANELVELAADQHTPTQSTESVRARVQDAIDRMVKESEAWAKTPSEQTNCISVASALQIHANWLATAITEPDPKAPRLGGEEA